MPHLDLPEGCDISGKVITLMLHLLSPWSMIYAWETVKSAGGVSKRQKSTKPDEY